MVVYDHVTTDLSRVEVIVPDFQEADGLVGDDMEDEDIERMVACIDQELLELVVMFIDPAAEIVGHEESENGRNGEREELLEGGTPVHVGREVLREEEDDDGKEQ